ncbi:MAG: c-type cytochrome [Steroidobacteraceae bacterium]
MRFKQFRSNNHRIRVLLVCATVILSTLGSAHAAGLPQIVHARQEHFRMLGRAAKSLRDQFGRPRLNWVAIGRDARALDRLASQLPSWFPPGSGQGHGVKTRARAAIWRNPQAFAQAAHLLLVRTQGLTQAAAHHDRRELMVNARALGHACGSCHSRFRAHSSWW